MKKRVLAVVLVALLAGTVFTGCGSEQAATQDSSVSEEVVNELDSETQEQVDEVEDVIDAIGVVTVYSGNKIKKARSKCNETPEEILDYVTNIEDLDTAEQKYEELIKTEAKDISDAIRSIGTVTVKSKDKIEAAREAYDDAPSVVQKAVKNVDTLKKAEKTYKKKLAEKKAADAKAAKERAAKEKSDFKAKCKTYDYKPISRSPGKYIGKPVWFCYQVLQVMEDGDYVGLRVATGGAYGYYDDVIMVTYTRGDKEDRILEDDMITVWGEMGDLYTYETVMGNELSIPHVYGKYVELS